MRKIIQIAFFLKVLNQTIKENFGIIKVTIHIFFYNELKIYIFTVTENIFNGVKDPLKLIFWTIGLYVYIYTEKKLQVVRSSDLDGHLRSCQGDPR